MQVRVSLGKMNAMRMLRTKGLAFLAMLVLLLGTAAPAMARMTCVMGGPSVLSVGQAEECVPTDHAHEATTVQATCCEVLQANPAHAAFVPAGGALLPLLFVMDVPVASAPDVLLHVSGTASRNMYVQVPPPLLRRLASFAHFRI